MNSNPEPSASPRPVLRSPRGSTLSCANWQIEAAFRMLQNNLDPEVAENPAALVVYGGIGKAARNHACLEQILRSLRELREDETLLVQSGKPAGVFRTHIDAPRVLIANSNLVPRWSTWEHFDELDRKGLMMYGQMTAGSWIYIGSQGIVQGTCETFIEAGRQHYGGNLTGRWILTAGLGGVGMGYSQHAGVVIVCDGTEAADRRIERVLWNDPATGVMRHADAGYPDAIACAREHGLNLPMITGGGAG